MYADTWRLNNHLLNDEWFKAEIKINLKIWVFENMNKTKRCFDQLTKGGDPNYQSEMNRETLQLALKKF